MALYVRYVPVILGGGAGGASITVGPFGSAPNNAGAIVTGGTILTLEPADATHPGGVSTTTQSFGGNKTLTAVGSTILAKDNPISTGIRLSVKDYGATGDGSTDDAAAINTAIAALTSGGDLYFPAGTYIVGSQITVGVSNVRLYGAGQGASVIKAKAAANFQFVLFASAQSGLVLEDFTVDANQVNRAAALTTSAFCIELTGCSNCLVKSVTVKNSLGTVSGSGVGLAVAGVGSKNIISGCTAVSCGTLAKPSDGFFVSGTQNLIIGCVANACVDTGFVIESSNQSGISGCTAVSCGAGAAITNATNSAVYGNYINGLTINNWAASTTGGMQFGNPLSSSTGDMNDTVVSNVIMQGAGTGPAINITKSGTANTVGIKLSNIIIDGAGTQGIVGAATDIMIDSCQVRSTGTCIQLQDGTLNAVVSNNEVYCPNVFGIIVNQTATTTDNISIVNNRLISNGTTAWGIFYLGTSTNCSTTGNSFKGTFSSGTLGADTTTAPRAITDIVFANAVPSTSSLGKWLQGTLVLNNSGTALDPIGWMCTTTGTAGSTAVFQTLYNSITLAAVGSAPSANGATISGQTLTLQPADATHPGVMTILTQTIAGAKTFSGTTTVGNLIDSGATINTVPYFDGSKQLTSSAVTPTELGYVSGVTSAIQTQLNAKQATGNYITALTGDVTATGPGSVASTVAKIAGTTVSATTGSTNVVFSASPTLTGTLTAATITASGIVSTSNTGNSATRASSAINTAGGINAAGHFWAGNTGSGLGGNYRVITDDGTERWLIGTLGSAAATNFSIFDLNNGAERLQIDSTSGAVAIHGTATNNSASAGFVGEYISSSVTTPTNIGTSTQWADMTSISLTAGDWDVTGVVDFFQNGSTVVTAAIGISSTSGNSSSGLVAGDNLLDFPGPTATNPRGTSIPNFRVLLSATTTYYFKVNMTYSIATPQIQCRFSARRMR